jgi:hypothetical protein
MFQPALPTVQVLGSEVNQELARCPDSRFDIWNDELDECRLATPTTPTNKNSGRKRKLCPPLPSHTPSSSTLRDGVHPNNYHDGCPVYSSRSTSSPPRLVLNREKEGRLDEQTSFWIDAKKKFLDARRVKLSSSSSTTRNVL